MSKRSEAVKKWRRNTKDRLVEAFGGACACCGIEGHSCIMDFHHLDESQKEFSLCAARAHAKSWKKVTEEARKCVMLCAICHRLHHNGLVDIPPDAPSFDEKYADYKSLRKAEELNDCPVCGTKKPNRMITCSRVCAARKSRKVDWDKHDKLLEQEVALGTPWVRIADKIGNISDVSVKKRAKKLNLI